MLMISVIWLLLPAGFANMAPIFAKQIFPTWNTPVDFGKTLRGKQIFGSHKTYRGLISGVIAGAIVFALQQMLYHRFLTIRILSYFNYEEVSILFGAWLGLCALLGDLVKSFFKRQLGIDPGTPWFPFDQIDWIVGSVMGLRIVLVPSFSVAVASFVIGLILHLVVKYFGFVWKLNPTPL